MHRFLETCAGYIYEKYSHDLQDICIVFPNRRASVFFTAYLQKLLDKPVISPQLTTIGEWMQSLSSLVVTERLILITKLYKIYKRITQTNETFDDFYFWGEILLADFDDIDKYRVNAQHLFQNIADVKEIEKHFDYLTDDQKDILNQFWGSLKNWETREQQRNFVSFWNKLYDVYTVFKEDLFANGIGYQGMAIMDGIEKAEKGEGISRYIKYIFIGHNALNECEKQLFRILKAQNKAYFLWDFDDWYVNEMANDAGKFMRENLLLFPPPEDFLPDCKTFIQPKEIEIVSVPSSYGQAQIIPSFFEKVGIAPDGTDKFDQTAVVLADESLLFPVLGALPSGISGINVTMGYPVKNSPVNGFLYLLATLLRNSTVEAGKETRIYFRLATDILNHQLIKGVCPEKVDTFMQQLVAHNKIYLNPVELYFSPVHELIFTLPGTTLEFPSYFLRILQKVYEIAGETNQDELVRELIYHIYMAVEKLQHALNETGDIPMLAPPVFFRVMNQYLSKVTVPFEGEPLSGVQVMGILETRCLDFDNLVIIGLNEEIWPRTFSSPSLIPYNLRKSFGLPGIDDQDAMYAYYFYRLIQRSGRISATWNSIREGISGGELSRYGFQMKLLSPHKVITRTLDFPFSGYTAMPISIPSSSAIYTKLPGTLPGGKILSPSAINLWLSCRLRFYFRYVLNIEEPDEVAEEIDRRLFGNIFHKSVETLYAPFVGKIMTRETLTALKKDKSNIENCIYKAFATEYFKYSENSGYEVKIEGKALLIFSTIKSYIHNLLDIDAENSPLTIYSLEQNYSAPFTIQIDGTGHTITVGGKIDRLDSVNGIMRVIDYKTGSLDSRDLSCNDFESLIDPNRKTRNKEIMQALIYGLVLRKKYYPDQPITATIYAILKLNDTSFNPSIRIGKTPMEMSEIEKPAEYLLKKILEGIYSPESRFTQTPFKERCRYCPYNLICLR